MPETNSADYAVFTGSFSVVHFKLERQTYQHLTHHWAINTELFPCRRIQRYLRFCTMVPLAFRRVRVLINALQLVLNGWDVARHVSSKRRVLQRTTGTGLAPWGCSRFVV